MESPKPTTDPIYDLATKIYVELVARNIEIAEGRVKLSASAPLMASLSIKLSEAFLEAEAEAKASKAPVKDFKLGSADIAQWGVK